MQEHDVDGDEGELAEGERGRWRAIHDRSLGNRELLRVQALPGLLVRPENGIKPIETFVWRIYIESSTKRIAMETGEVQFGDWFTPEDLEALAATGAFVANQTPSMMPLPSS